MSRFLVLLALVCGFVAAPVATTQKEILPTVSAAQASELIVFALADHDHDGTEQRPLKKWSGKKNKSKKDKAKHHSHHHHPQPKHHHHAPHPKPPQKNFQFFPLPWLTGPPG